MSNERLFTAIAGQVWAASASLAFILSNGNPWSTGAGFIMLAFAAALVGYGMLK